MLLPSTLVELGANKGLFVVCSALADWAVLSVDPTGIYQPSWRFRSLKPEDVERYSFQRQSKDQQFECFLKTSKWHSILSDLSGQYDSLFRNEQVSQDKQFLSQSTKPLKLYDYPYDKAQAWHSAYTERERSVISWITERMVSQDEQTAERFVQSLLTYWLAQYNLEELPTSSSAPPFKLNHRRGYVLYLMSINFEHRLIRTAEECEKL